MDLYYHLHDDDSQKTMMEFAKSNSTDLAEDRFEDSLRAVGQSKIGEDTQVPELQELIDVNLADENITERAGFDLPSFCKLMKNLYLQLNTKENKDLGTLISLLLKHDFILF